MNPPVALGRSPELVGHRTALALHLEILRLQGELEAVESSLRTTPPVDGDQTLAGVALGDDAPAFEERAQDLADSMVAALYQAGRAEIDAATARSRAEADAILAEARARSGALLTSAREELAFVLSERAEVLDRSRAVDLDAALRPPVAGPASFAEPTPVGSGRPVDLPGSDTAGVAAPELGSPPVVGAPVSDGLGAGSSRGATSVIPTANADAAAPLEPARWVRPLEVVAALIAVAVAVVLVLVLVG